MKFPITSEVMLCTLLPAVIGGALGLLLRVGASTSAEAVEAKRSTLVSAAATKPDPRFAARLQSLSAAEFVSLIGELDDLPAHQREIARSIAVLNWAKLDPRGAAAFADENGFPFDTRRLIYREWAISDMGSALATWEVAPSEAKALGILPVLAESDFARAWNLAQPAVEGARSLWIRPDLFGTIFRNWIAHDMQAAASAAGGAGKAMFAIFADQLVATAPGRCAELLSTAEDWQIKFLLDRWHDHAPEAALAETRKLVDDPRFHSDLKFLSAFAEMGGELSDGQLSLLANRGFENRDPFAILDGDDTGEWIELTIQQCQQIYARLEAFRQNPAFRREFAEAWGENDPRGGLRWLKSLDATEQAELAPLLIARWVTSDDSQGAIDYLKALPDAESALVYRCVFAAPELFRSSRHDELKQRGLTWYQSLPDDERSALIRQLPAAALQHDPGGLLRWAIAEGTALAGQESLPIGDTSLTPTFNPDPTTGGWLENIKQESFNTWLTDDPGAATAWLAGGATDQETRDWFLARLDAPRAWSPYESRGNPTGTEADGYPILELMNQIADPLRRIESMSRVLRTASPSDAQEKLDAADLPAATRAELQELIDTATDFSDPSDPFADL